MYLAKCILVLCAFSALLGESEGSIIVKIKSFFRVFFGKIRGVGWYKVKNVVTFDKYWKQLSKQDKLLVIYFRGDFCEPCKVVGPLMTDLVYKYPKVKFMYFDMGDDDMMSLAATKFQVSRLPQVHFYRQGEKVGEPIADQVDKKMSDIETKIIKQTQPKA